eukprot:CAMPEP_0114627936 /NCGR_PEP_ID=MMETSP0168-20121206/12557_1 /TAXON_ID=95228 ORGANISM="Vannella sp., Strain DIVA3 517/6/12" /NCGR_SAMPLE_ID=MMETSP0168 /ASSEMBLY_ACC=CAM_ASM_000044 /LENGTH=511 /DNA_ID=CAMNT_0001839293 /DNA_START=27 /DNA_END=1562 /DNA_ORIENTATION=+
MAVTAHSFHCQVVLPSDAFTAPAFTVQSLLEPFLEESGFVFLNAVPPVLDVSTATTCVVALGQRRGGNVLSQTVVARGAIPGMGNCVDVHLTRLESSEFSIRHPAWNTAYNKGQDTRKRLGICVPDTRWLEGDVRLVSRVCDALVPTSGTAATTTFVLEMIAVPKRKQEAPFKVDLVRCSSGKFDDAHYLICDENNGRRSVGPWYLVDLYQRNYSKRLKEAHKVVCLSVYRTEKGQTMPSSAVPPHFMATHIVNREKWPQNLQRDLSLPPWCTLRGTSHVARGSAVDTELVLSTPDLLQTHAANPSLAAQYSMPYELFDMDVDSPSSPTSGAERSSLCNKRTSAAVPLSTKRSRRKFGGQDHYLSSFDDSDLMELVGDASPTSDECEFLLEAGSANASTFSSFMDERFQVRDARMLDTEVARAGDQPSASFGIPQYTEDAALAALKQKPTEPIPTHRAAGDPSSWDYNLVSFGASPESGSDSWPDCAWNGTADAMEEEDETFSWADRLMSP